jgi:hypothetical protein
LKVLSSGGRLARIGRLIWLCAKRSAMYTLIARPSAPADQIIVAGGQVQVVW